MPTHTRNQRHLRSIDVCLLARAQARSRASACVTVMLQITERGSEVVRAVAKSTLAARQNRDQFSNLYALRCPFRPFLTLLRFIVSQFSLIF